MELTPTKMGGIIFIGSSVISYLNMSEGMDLKTRFTGAAIVGAGTTVTTVIGGCYGAISGFLGDSIFNPSKVGSPLTKAGAIFGTVAGLTYGGYKAQEITEDYILQRNDNKTAVVVTEDFEKAPYKQDTYTVTGQDFSLV